MLIPPHSRGRQSHHIPIHEAGKATILKSVLVPPCTILLTKILMISSFDPAVCVFANKYGEVRKSVQSFKDTLLFHDLRH